MSLSPAPAPEAGPRREPDPRPVVLFPKGLGIAIVVLLSLQLALGYVQGALLHRQQDQLSAVRADLQELTEAVAQGQGAWNTEADGDQGWRPAGRARAARPAYALATLAVLDGDEEDRARKELQQSRETARKGVEDARKAQQQLSVEEAARKAETQQKTEAAQSAWMKWSLLAVAAVAVGLMARAWLRRRG